MKKVKRLDVIIIIGLLVLSFVPYLIFKTYGKESEENYYAAISVGGEVVRRVELKPDVEDEFTIDTKYGSNNVHVDNGKIGIVEADCNDSVCVYQGFIEKPGQQIVCLPHKLIITIEGKDVEEKGEDIISR